jgi:Na+/melibiose symporter-like transporter
VLLTGDETTGISPEFYIIMITLGITCAFIIFSSSFFIKENKYAMLEEPLGIIDAIKETFKNKPFMIYMVAVFVLLFSQNIITTAIYYYIDYVLNISGFMSVIPVLMLFGVIFVFTIVFSQAIQKYGVKKVILFGLVFTGMSLIILFFLGGEYILAVFSLFLVGIGFSAVLISTHVIFTDTIDYDETKTGKRRETTYSGVQALLTKPAISIANWLFLLIISAFGFQEDLAIQSDFTKLGIMFGFTIIPSICALLSVIVMIYYPLDGPEWMEQKQKLMLIHEKKEKEYLEHLKKEGKL